MTGVLMSISSIGDIHENAAHTSHHASFGTFLVFE